MIDQKTQTTKWPFVRRTLYESLQTENFMLRGALRLANEELQKHRRLIGGLRTGQEEMTKAVERALAKDA